MSKKILMVAGPNGAGKTTMCWQLIPDCSLIYEFVNADEIARGLAPLNPETVELTASKLMVKRLKELLENSKSFAFETTASGVNYIKYLETAKKNNYEINLVFLWLNGPEEAILRVAQRVKQGGHYVPDETVKRRYYAGLKNLVKYYLPLADTAVIINNSSEQAEKGIIAKKEKNQFKIQNNMIWDKIGELANER